MTAPSNNAKNSTGSVSIGTLLLVVGAIAVGIANFGLGPRLERAEEEVRWMRWAAGMLHVTDPDKIAIVGKPRVGFNDLKYEVYLPPDHDFVICGSGGRAFSSENLGPRVMAPIASGLHTIEFFFIENESPDSSGIELKVDQQPSIFLPVDFSKFASGPADMLTLMYRTSTSFEPDSGVDLLYGKPSVSSIASVLIQIKNDPQNTPRPTND